MTGVPATPDMHFRNGAVAIAYIGTVLLQLRDTGKLGLDDTLATWFPDYPKADQRDPRHADRRHLGLCRLRHRRRLPRRLPRRSVPAWTPDELIAIGLARPMACDPGTCWSYAHTNFVILGKVIEKATGRPLDALIREGIVDPLGLTGTRSEMTAVDPRAGAARLRRRARPLRGIDLLGPVLDAGRAAR